MAEENEDAGEITQSHSLKDSTIPFIEDGTEIGESLKRIREQKRAEAERTKARDSDGIETESQSESSPTDSNLAKEPASRDDGEPDIEQQLVDTEQENAPDSQDTESDEKGKRQSETPASGEDSSQQCNSKQVLTDAANLLRQQQNDDTIPPLEDSLVLHNTQLVLDEIDDTLQRHQQIRGAINPDDTTLMRNPQRVMDLVDSLFRDNARLRREKNKDHEMHSIIWGSMLTVIVILSGVVIMLMVGD